MSSVSSMPPRFGVSAVFFHGSGGPGARPLTMSADALAVPVGGKRITSNFSRRFGVRAASCVEIYVNGTPSDSSARRYHPSSCVRSHVCSTARRGSGFVGWVQAYLR